MNSPVSRSIWSVNSKKVMVTELTIPFEANMDWAHQRKLEKYDDLREKCVKNGWSIDIFPLEIRCWGFILDSTSTFLTKLGLSPAEGIHKIKMKNKTVTASVRIWHSYSVVLMWDTAVAPWVRGNNVSDLKPCLNPGSSSDDDLLEEKLLFLRQFLNTIFYVCMYVCVCVWVYICVWEGAYKMVGYEVHWMKKSFDDDIHTADNSFTNEVYERGHS